MERRTRGRVVKRELMMGNEAIARGASEAGVGIAAGYPGTPSSEIVAALAAVADKFNIYVEWSVNEKVALEVAAGASLAGIRALCTMKQNGLNVASDFLANLCLSGVEKGLLLVVCDDPGGVSSTNEQDSRHLAKILDIPLLEPATFQEAKDMTQWGFELSERIGTVCMLRSVTRISHARGNVIPGPLPGKKRAARFDTSKQYATISVSARFHRALHKKLNSLEKVFDDSPFNEYRGPEKPDLLIVTSGAGWLYSLEARGIIPASDRVGVLKIATN